MSYLDRPQEDWEMGQDAEDKRREPALTEAERLSNVECDLRLANEALAARYDRAVELLGAWLDGRCPNQDTESFLTTDSADDDPYRRAAQQSLDAEREGLARARADGTAERAVDDLLKILGK
jgi:hypothetical protein